MKKFSLLGLTVVFLWTGMIKAEGFKFKTSILERNKEHLRVKVEIYSQDKVKKILICTDINKTFRLKKGGTAWYFTPKLENGKIAFEIEKKTMEVATWKDCCAKCAGGWEACGDCVCCMMNGNSCCDAAWCCDSCKPKK